MKTSLLIFALGAILATPASAGDVLWYLGHNGYDEGHTQIVNLLQTQEGASVDVVNTTPLPSLDSYTLVFIVMPGFFDSADFFTVDEKDRLNAWLTDARHRVVMVGDWDQFYHGQDVMNDLLAAIGNPIVFDPGAYDTGCGHCNGPLTNPDPLTAGINQICYGLTPTWDPAHGVGLADPEDPNAPGPWVVSNGTDIPCIVGIGDQNALTDPCGYMGPSGNLDSQTFARRLYTINCAGVQIQFGLEPISAVNEVGTTHTVTAHVEEGNTPVSGVTVTFSVVSGPHAGVTGDGVTDATGDASFSYVGTSVGTDVLVATYVSNSVVHTSNEAVKEWIPGSNNPPDCKGASASVGEIWPPDHELVPVGIVGVTEPDGDPVTITATGVTQDEPLNDLGDGATCPDAVIVDGQAEVRAERTGTGNGRVYRVTFTATDDHGGSCEGAVVVCVPRDQRPGHVCVDDGQSVNSLDLCKEPTTRSHQVATGEVEILALAAQGTTARVEYRLSNAGEVELSLFDVAGRRVVSVDRSYQAAGVHTVSWDTRGLVKGMYFYRLRAGSTAVTRSVLIGF